MNYVIIPNEVSMLEIIDKDYSLSPSMYKKIKISNKNVKKIGELIEGNFVEGEEIGSIAYMKESKYYFIRTKSLQPYSSILYFKGDSVVPINPKYFIDFKIKEGDILFSKDSNIGECCYIESNDYKNFMISSGFLKLDFPYNKLYIFAFLKHKLTKTQLDFSTPKGATIRHSGNRFLDCFIPFPNQKNAEEVIKYVEVLMRVIIDKEKEIRDKNKKINEIIGEELISNQNRTEFIYEFPTIKEIMEIGRLDTGLYSQDYKHNQFLIKNYKFGSKNIFERGFEIRRGQNLQISCIGKSIYLDNPKNNFYRLIRPTNLSDFRTIARLEYLGNKNTLEEVRKGDILFSAEGVIGKTHIFCDEQQKTITNIHGILINKENFNLNENIFIGCFLGYLREVGILDKISVGSQGGSLAKIYFDNLLFPNFPENKQNEITKLYYNSNPIERNASDLNLDNFISEHRNWNKELGIYQLGNQINELKIKLNKVLEEIIEDKEIKIEL